MSKGKLLILVGGSSAGKTSLAKAFQSASKNCTCYGYAREITGTH